MKPFRINHGIGTLCMVPTRLFLGVLTGVVAKASAKDVVHSKTCLIFIHSM